MKQLLLSFVCMFALTATMHAQTTILDFEDAATTTTFQSFGGAVEGNVDGPIANPDPSGINTSDSVMIHVKPSDAPEWGGAFSNPIPATPVDLTAAGSMIKMKVWMPTAGIVRFKLEESTTGAGNWEADQTASAGGEWVELTWDPTTPSAAGDGVVAAGNSYNKVVVFFDFGTPGNGTDDWTYYFDDIVVTDGTPPPPMSDVVILDFEDAATTTTFQSFGGAVEGNVDGPIANPDPSGINTSDSVMIHVKPSDAPEWGGAFSNPVPATPVDLTAAGSMIKMKVWMPTAGIVRFKLEESTTGAGNWEADQTAPAGGEWVELTWDPTTPSAAGDGVVAAGNSYNKVVVFFDFGTPGNGTDDWTYYFDDIMVSSATTSISDLQDQDLFTIAPNPATDYVEVMLSEVTTNASELRVLDMQGRQVMHQELNRGVERLEIRTTDWPAGLYFVHLRNGQRFGIHKLIVE